MEYFIEIDRFFLKLFTFIFYSSVSLDLNELLVLPTVSYLNSFRLIYFPGLSPFIYIIIMLPNTLIIDPQLNEMFLSLFDPLTACYTNSAKNTAKNKKMDVVAGK